MPSRLSGRGQQPVFIMTKTPRKYAFTLKIGTQRVQIGTTAFPLDQARHIFQNMLLTYLHFDPELKPVRDKHAVAIVRTTRTDGIEEAWRAGKDFEYLYPNPRGTYCSIRDFPNQWVVIVYDNNQSALLVK